MTTDPTLTATASVPTAAALGFVGITVVRQVEGENWVTVEPLRYTATRQRFEVPVGSSTDFASVPRVFAWLVPRSGASVAPAILHDYLWRVEAPAGRIKYREADGILRQALRLRGVPFVLRWLYWSAVRWTALTTRRRGHVGWLRDAPLVALWTLFALPVVVPPAVLIILALAVLQVVEAMTWLVLRSMSDNQVNPPKVTMKT